MTMVFPPLMADSAVSCLKTETGFVKERADFIWDAVQLQEEYYNNKVQWTNGYQPIPLAYGKKFDVHDKIQSPQVHLPYYHLTPLVISGPALAAVPPDKENGGKEDKEKKDEAGGEKEMMMEEESVEMTTMRSDEEASEEDTGVNWRIGSDFDCRDGYIVNGICYDPEKKSLFGYSKCGAGKVQDERGNCLTRITPMKRVITFDRIRKRLEDTRDASKNRIMMKKESLEMTTVRSDEEDTGATWKPYTGYAAYINKCGDGYTTDANGNCLKEISKGVKTFGLDRKKREDVQDAFKDGDNEEVMTPLKPVSPKTESFDDDSDEEKDSAIFGKNKGLEYKKVRNSSRCKYGLIRDEYGDCLKSVARKEKIITLDRKKRADMRNASKDRMIFKLSKKISVRDKRSPKEKERRELQMAIPSTCRDTHDKDEGGRCVKKISLKNVPPKYSVELLKALRKPKDKKTSEMSKVKSFRKERSAEEKKPSYADVLKYGRRGPPLLKPTEPKGQNRLVTTSTSSTTSTSTAKPASAPSVAPLSQPEVIKPQPTVPTKTPSTLINRRRPTVSSTEASKPVEPPKPGNSISSPAKPAAVNPSLRLINSEKNPGTVEESNSKPNAASGFKLTTPNPFLYLLNTYCENGYQQDENGNCIKAITKKHGIKEPNLDRKRRNTDFNSELFRKLYNEAERNRQLRNSEQTVFQRRDKKIENYTRSTESVLTPLVSDKSSQDISEKIPSDEKNAASDGFGYISKECSRLVPGLVSDGAGGCTKAVKVKEKILQLERRKRQARTAFINFIDPNNRLRKNNFTITITIKGLNKQLNEAQNQPLDGGDKAVADNGFGVTSSKCDNIVPGLVPDGAGGCTKAITTFKKKNKFSFIVRNVENSQPVIDLDYENPEPELVSINPGDDDDPDADII